MYLGGDVTNAYTALVNREMQRRGLSLTQLADRTSLTKQNLSRILNDTRETLKQRPDPETVEKLASGLNIPRDLVWSAVAEAMGIPVSTSNEFVRQIDEATDEELVAELSRRMGLTISAQEKPDEQDHDPPSLCLVDEAARADSPSSKAAEEQRKQRDAVGEESQDSDPDDWSGA